MVSNVTRETTRRTMTIPEAADFLHIGTCTLRRLVRSGAVASVRFGGRAIRITPEAIEAYLTAQQAPKAAPAPVAVAVQSAPSVQGRAPMQRRVISKMRPIPE